MSKFRQLGEGMLSLVFPRRCPLCDRPVRPYGALACPECEKKVKYVRGAVCYKCGKPLEDPAEEYCADCASHKHLYNSGMSLFEYRSVSDSIYRFKYRGRREYAAWYGKQMAEKLGSRIKMLEPDMLVPVPIHSGKRKIRGYNQAELIAEVMSKRLNIPSSGRLVKRIKKTTPLKDLAPEERNNILRGAFKLTDDVVKLKTIVIIDDIYTTGATVDAVAAPFIRAGVQNIYFASLAIGKGV